MRKTGRNKFGVGRDKQLTTFEMVFRKSLHNLLINERTC